MFISNNIKSIKSKVVHYYLVLNYKNVQNDFFVRCILKVFIRSQSRKKMKEGERERKYIEGESECIDKRERELKREGYYT